MTPPVLGLDHLLLLVNSLDTACATMERLGFTVSPRGLHSAHLGSANHTIMFEKEYIELWGVVTPTDFNALHRANLALGEGVHTVALKASTVEAARERLEVIGIRAGEPVSFSRPVELPNGSGEASFTVLRPLKEDLPNGFMFFCQHRTPEVVWVPEWMRHANTAQRLAAIVVEAEDPVRTAAVYGPIFADVGEHVEGGVAVRTGNALLEFLSPAAIEARYGTFGVAEVGSPYYKVARVAVADSDAAASVLQKNGVDFVEDAGRILVRPREAHGIILEFVGA